MTIGTHLIGLYIPLILWVSLGIVLGRMLPARIPNTLGQGLFWFGVPVSIAVFLRQADLSGSIWLAPAIAWLAVVLSASLAWLWINLSCRKRPLSQSTIPEADLPIISWDQAAKGSFLNASMLGNTGYLGYPIVLALVDSQYFAWAVFYDTLGSTLASYGLAVALASHFSQGFSSRTPTDHPPRHLAKQTIIALAKTPALWGFGLGIIAQPLPLPTPMEQGLRGIAWMVISLALLLLGMRLSQVKSWNSLHRAIASLLIKMLMVPLAIGLGLNYAVRINLLTIEPSSLLILVLQAGMPPAFATLIIAEAYHLDRELAVTTLALGSIGILLTLPLWLALFGA